MGMLSDNIPYPISTSHIREHSWNLGQDLTLDIEPASHVPTIVALLLERLGTSHKAIPQVLDAIADAGSFFKLQFFG